MRRLSGKYIRLPLLLAIVLVLLTAGTVYGLTMHTLPDIQLWLGESSVTDHETLSITGYDLEISQDKVIGLHFTVSNSGEELSATVAVTIKDGADGVQGTGEFTANWVSGSMSEVIYLDPPVPLADCAKIQFQIS